MVLGPCLRQAPAPSQVPSKLHVDAGAAAQSVLCVVPALTGAHVPSAAFVFVARHDMHFAAHALLQQMPSTHVAPDTHSRDVPRSEEHTSELQSHHDLVCRLLLEKKKKKTIFNPIKKKKKTKNPQK